MRYTVETFLRELAGRRVHLWEDNQAVVQVLTHQTSRSPALMRQLRRLWWTLDMHQIHLRVSYIRSEANVWADQLSRERDLSDWRLNPKLFREVVALWGHPTVDRFASANNCQVPRYNSRWRDPLSEAVDAFSIPDEEWRRELNWANPPWELLPRPVQKLRYSGAACHVVAPFWPSAHWFTELLDMSSDWRVIPAHRALFLPGRLGSVAAVGAPGWSACVFRLRLREPRPQ